jgi:uncharacterized membrane protein
MGHTIMLVENATAKAIEYRLNFPTLKGIHIAPDQDKGIPVYGTKIGYVQLLNLNKIQELAKNLDVLITVKAIPGTFTSLDKPLFYVWKKGKDCDVKDYFEFRNAFTIGDMRYFDEDPRFGLITLSEIASRALSPAVNDPGTAIQIIGCHVRLFSMWNNKAISAVNNEIIYNRVAVERITIADCLEDAFRPIARDGASNIEVMLRLQKAFESLSKIDNYDMKLAAKEHAIAALQRAEKNMTHKPDIDLVKSISLFGDEL